MAEYDILEAGFSNNDETINFGRRAVGDHRNLYEVCTLAVIRSSDNYSANFLPGTLQIKSYCHNGRIFFSIHKILRIMKDKEMSDEIGSFKFDSIIDTFCISPCERFLIICTRDGNIVIKDLALATSEEKSDQNESMITSVFSQKLEENSSSEGCFFTGTFVNDSDILTFYIVTYRGLITKITLTIDNSDSHFFKSEIILDLNRKINICAFGYPYICLEGTELIMINIETSSFNAADAIGLTNINSIGSTFFAYDKEGNIYAICSLTLLTFCLNEKYAQLVNRFDDFIILADSEDKSKVQIAGMTKPKENKFQIELLTYPALNEIYSITLDHPIHLMHIEGLTEEVLFFTEIHKANCLTELRLQYVTESDPELRVKRLIHKQLFEEAEIFAKNYNVNPEIVSRAKAQHILNKMACNSKDVSDLLNILDGIDDQLFRLNCCDIVDCESGEDTRKVLCYGAFMDISVRDSSKNEGNLVLNMKRCFNQKLFRFDTFMQVYKTYDHQRWLSFVESDFIEELKNSLKNGEIEAAVIIYSRLDTKGIRSLTIECIQEIISIFNKLPKKCMSFLTSFIPLTLKYRPDTLSIFVKWLHERVYQLEMQYASEFPEIGIKFVEQVTQMMDLNVPIRKQSNIEDSLSKLANLPKALKDLQMLANNFEIKVPLSEYLMTPSNIVRNLLSTEMDDAHFEALMKEFLCPFILKHGLDRDSLFLQEIKILLSYKEEYWIQIVTILLRFISNVDTKLEAIKEILETANTPWCETVKKIGCLSFEFSTINPVAKEIADIMENENQIIILQKYNINRKHFESLNDKQFYFNRICYLNKNAVMEDIHHLCKTSEDREEADLIMIKNYVQRENYSKAMDILDNNSPEQICKLSKRFIDFILQLVISQNVTKKSIESYYQVLNLFWNRVQKYCQSSKEKNEIEVEYNFANAAYKINNTFRIKVKLRDFTTKNHRDVLLKTLMQHAAQLIEDERDFETLISVCKKISSLMQLTLDAVFIKFLDQTDNFNLILKIGDNTFDTSKCSKTLSLCAIYLFKYIKASFNERSDETFLDVMVDLGKEEDYLLGMKLARKLAIKAMMYATSEDHSAVMEVMRWVDSCYCLTNLQKRYVNADAYQFYLPSNTAYPFVASSETVKIIFNIYCRYIETFRNPNTRYLTYFTTNVTVNQIPLSNALEEFTFNIRMMLKEDQHLTAYNVIKTLQQALLYDPHIKMDAWATVNSFIQKTWLPQTIDSLLSRKDIDKALLFNLMLLFDKHCEVPLNNYLQIYKRQPNKISCIAEVGLELLKFHGILQGRDDLKNIINMCKWWEIVKDSKLNYTNFFASNCKKRLNELILLKQVNLGNLADYCKDFGLDLQSSYMKLLKMTLLDWKPDVEYTVDVSGKKGLIIKNNEVELTRTCCDIIQRINDKSEVYKLTEKIWSSVNFYYYEIYIALLSIQKTLGQSPSKTAYRQLLLFLKIYKRVSKPSRSEIEQWYGAYPFSAIIDPLSEFRLPLTSTFLSSDIWTIIKPEVNLKTYKEWFKVSYVLEQYLNKHDICTYAINNVQSESTCTTWELYPKYENLVAQVDECARNITDLERATAAVYTLMCGMPPGADKVNLAELSYKYAQIYRQKCSSEDVEKVFVKVKQRYFNYSAMHILHKYQLADKKYINFVAQPLDLIMALYSDSRILKQINTVNFYCPDINKAVDELCELFKLGAKKVRLDLISEYLKTHTPLDLDSTAVMQVFKNQDLNEANYLKRACYICSSTDPHVWQKYMLRIGMDKETTETNMTVRANALRCLYYISDVDTIEEITHMTYEEFLDFINKLLLISKLNDLRICIDSVDQLNSFNKKMLMNNLAKLNEPLAIKCIASLCKIYNLDDMKYWDYILNAAIQFNMISELGEYVEYLKFRCVTESIKKAWHIIFSDAFSLGFTQSEKNECSNSQITEAYIKTLRLLQTCPVIYSLDFGVYIEKCISNNKLDIAAVLLQYMPEEKHSHYIEKLTSSRTIIKDLIALKNEGIVGISTVIEIIKQ